MRYDNRNDLRSLLISLLAVTMLAACGEATEPAPTEEPETSQEGKGDITTTEQTLSEATQACRAEGDELLSAAMSTAETVDAYQHVIGCHLDQRLLHREALFGDRAEDLERTLIELRGSTNALCAKKAVALEGEGSLADILALGCEAEVEEAINYLLDGNTDVASRDFEAECQQDKSELGDDAEAWSDVLFGEYECAKELADRNVGDIAEILFAELPEAEGLPEPPAGAVELNEAKTAGLAAADELAMALSYNEDLDSLVGEQFLTINQTRAVDLLVIASSDPYSYEP